MVRQTRSQVMSLAGLAAALLLLPSLGCHALGKKKNPDDDLPVVAAKPAPPTPKPGTPAAKLVATWRKEVQAGTDPVTQKPIAGVMGRVYLMEKSGAFPVPGDGSISVALYDHTGDEAKELEVWNFPAEVLPQVLQADAVGQGYTLALPWSSYKPEITQVRYRVTYTPKKGEPLSTSSEVITLEHGAVQQALSKKKNTSVASAKN